MSFGSKPPRQQAPQPWNSTQISSPAAWLDPFLQGGMGMAGQIFNDRLAGGGAPPTFGDVTSGRYSSTFGPGGGAGGGAGGLDFPLPGRVPGGMGSLPDFEALGIPGIDFAGRGGGGGGGRGGGPSPRDRGPRGRRGGGGGGGGGRRGGGDGMSPLRREIAEMMVSRAREPSAALGQGTDFLTNFFSNPGGTPGGLMAQQTYDDTRSPDAPTNQLIDRQMTQGNPAGGMQQDFISRLFDRFDTPVPVPGDLAPRYDLMSQFGASEPLFDVGGGVFP